MLQSQSAGAATAAGKCFVWLMSSVDYDFSVLTLTFIGHARIAR